MGAAGKSEVFMKRFFSILLIISFLPFCFVAEETDEGTFPQKLEVSAIKELPRDGAEICIECDVLKAQIYLNNIFYGYSKLTVKDLSPGEYVLSVYKEGYKKCEYIIEVRKKYRLTYRTVLEKTVEKSGDV